MSIKKASSKVNLSYPASIYYYKQYKENPNEKLGGPRKMPTVYTHGQIKAMIEYIVKDGMTVKEAAIKANIKHRSAVYIYTRYRSDPDHNIPMSRTMENQKSAPCSYKQVKQVLSYIVDDKLPILVASIGAKMSLTAARKYYHQYLSHPDHKIPVPKRRFHKPCAKVIVQQLIDLVVKDKMSVLTAAMKLNITESTARK